MPEPEYVRVLDKATGHKLSLIASSVANATDAYEVLDEPATGLDGLPLAPQYATAAPSGEDLTELYLKRTRTDLENEVAKRNEGRADEDLIVVDAPGNKPEIAAALVTDDATHPQKENDDA